MEMAENVKVPSDPEVKNIIDKLANFVARNGAEFEKMTKQKQKDNPKFQFLFGGEHYPYYQSKVKSEQLARQEQKQKIAEQQAKLQEVITQQSIQTAPWQPQIQQQQQIQDKIKESEDNLAKQRQLLLGQQKDQMESVVMSNRLDKIQSLAQAMEVNLSEFDATLQAIIDSCTKDAISAGKQWIFAAAKSPQHAEVISKYLLQKIAPKNVPFTTKLHLIYLINDTLHHCVKREAKDLHTALSTVIIPIFCGSYLTANDENKAKLDKVLKLWETNQYFREGIIDQLKKPSASMSTYQAFQIKENHDAIQQVLISTQEKIKSLEKQHSEYVAHCHIQQQQRQKEMQEQHQLLLQQQQQELEKQQKIQQQLEQLKQQEQEELKQKQEQIIKDQMNQHEAVSVAETQATTTSQAQVSQGVVSAVSQSEAVIASSSQGETPQSSGVATQAVTMPPSLATSMPSISHPAMLPPPGTLPGLPSDPTQMFPMFDPSRPPPGFPAGPPPFQPGLPPPNFPQFPPMPGAPFPPPDMSVPPPGFGGPPPHLDLPHQRSDSPHHGPPMGGPPPPMMDMMPPMLDPNDPSLIPQAPYYELPAGLMVTLIKLEDTDYKPIDPRDIRLPPPQPPSQRLIEAIEAFYAPPSRENPRNTDGWEQNGLFEFFKVKAKYSAERKERDQRRRSRSRSRGRRRSRSRSPPRRRYRSKSRSRSASPPYQRSSRSPTPPRTARRRSPSPPYRRSSNSPPYQRSSMSPPQRSAKSPPHQRSAKSPPYQPSANSPPYQRSSKSRSKSRSRSRSKSRSRSRSRSRSKSRSPVSKKTPPGSPAPDYGVQPFYQVNADTKLGEDNKGHQLMKKMGWSGAGLGAQEQGRVEPVAGGEVREKMDQFKGVGVAVSDPFENFRKTKSYTFNRRGR